MLITEQTPKMMPREVRMERSLWARTLAAPQPDRPPGELHGTVDGHEPAALWAAGAWPVVWVVLASVRFTFSSEVRG